MTQPYQLKVVDAFAKASAPFSGKTLLESQDWLKEVLNPPVAAEIERVVDEMRNKEAECEPLLFDIYLGEASAALDRCLRLRREIQDIEVAATSYAREYERFFKTLGLDQKLDERTRIVEQAKQLQAGFRDAAQAIKPNDNSDIAGGLGLQITALGASHGAAALEQQERNDLLRHTFEPNRGKRIVRP